jgi:carnitine-CoA ligase
MGDGSMWGSAPRRTLGEVVASTTARFPKNVALRFGEVRVTYTELDARSNSFGNALLDLGVGHGDCVAVMMENCPESVYAWIGLGKIGGVEVGVNNAYRGEYLRHMLATTRTAIVLCDAMYAQRIIDIAGELPDLARIVIRGEFDDLALESPGVAISSMEAFFAADAGAVKVDRVPVYSDPCAVQFTGGTTGRSKGAIMSHNMQITVAQGFVDASHQTSEDVIYSPLPMFHFAIKSVVLLSSFVAGGTAAVDERFSVSRTWDQVRYYEATGISILGSMILMLWNLPAEERDHEVPIRFMVATPIPEHLHRQIEERYGCRLVSVYGMSETGSQTIGGIDEPGVPGACGKPVGHFDLKIFDADDHELPPGEVGEIVVRPLQPHVMCEGYYGDPEGTLAVVRDLWFHTGDLGRFDDDGNLYFVDRLKDAIRRRGENISSVEVELIILKHPAVKEAIIHAVPSEFTEDDVKLCVVTDPDQDATPEILMDFCVAYLPFFAVPRYIEFLVDIPRTPVGRPQKNVLRDRGVTPQTWDREAAGYVVTR